MVGNHFLKSLIQTTMEENSVSRAIWPILIGVILVMVLGIFVAPMQKLEYEIEIKVGSSAFILLAAVFILQRSRKKSTAEVSYYLVGLQNLLLAFLALAVITALTFLVAYAFEKFDPSDVIAYSMQGVLSAVCSFFLIRRKPESVAFVPLIINLVTIIAAMSEKIWARHPQGVPMGYPLVGGWILTALASWLAYRKGMKKLEGGSEK
jgi:hypothetical protein